MPHHPNVKICTHIKVAGVPCGSPALVGQRFCYFHERMIHGVPTPPKSRIHPMALIENEEGIQAALMETINAIVRNTIDLKRASLILRALSIAAQNARRVHFGCLDTQMVRTIPDYPAPPAKAPRPPEEASPAASAEKDAQTKAMQTWDQHWNRKTGSAPTEASRKPAGKVAAVAAQAQGAAGLPLRE
jgi:hypothetical protein